MKPQWLGFMAGIAVSAFTNIATGLSSQSDSLIGRILAMLCFLAAGYYLTAAAGWSEVACSDPAADSPRTFSNRGEKHMRRGFIWMGAAVCILTECIIVEAVTRKLQQ